MYSAALPSGSAPAHRLCRAVVTIRDAAGVPVPNAEIVVTQTRHGFGFGNIGFDFVPLTNGAPDDVGTEELAELYTDIFNTATLPFYWGRFERNRGAPDTARLLRTARWFRDRGVALKGHPRVAYGAARLALRSAAGGSRDTAAERIHREVSDFEGAYRHLGRHQRSRHHASLEFTVQSVTAELVVTSTRKLSPRRLAVSSVRGSGCTPPQTVGRALLWLISIGSSIEISTTSSNMFFQPTNHS